MTVCFIITMVCC